MAAADPPRDWQDLIHQRVTQQDPTAFAELCEIALPHLIAFLEGLFADQSAHLRETVAIDLLLGYQSKPEQYDSRQLSLFAYLKMAARYDMLNQIDKQQRHARRLLSLADPAVELLLRDRNTLQESDELDEWLRQRTDRSFGEIVLALRAELEAVEEQVLMLMLDGVRDTATYAGVLGITHLDEVSQRREVKRTKDRILKRLQRLGRRIGRA
jgi:RNA polymerase sigma-70 factor (ECF subfamily)